MLTKPDLIKMIRTAWTDATPPQPGNISQPTYDDECVADYFSNKPWQEQSAAQLRLLTHALTFFTDEAFVYTLPAYLIADIEEPEVSDTNAEGILSRLASSEGPAMASRLNV